jgi:long-chain acyl-CoA synthetase
MTLGSLLHSQAARHPRKTALFCRHERMTYEELDASSSRAAQWLVEQGLHTGDRVAVHWSNSIEAVELLFGIFKAGLIAVPINLRLKPLEIAYQFRHSGAVLCFSEPALAPLAEEARGGCPALRRILTSVPESGGTAALPDIDENQPAVVLYTSGTTAQPKGTTHTHWTLTETVRQVGHGILDEHDTMLAMTSLMHATGLTCILLQAVYLGATAAFVPVFHPDAVLDAIERFRCTYTVALPALLQFLVEAQVRQPRDVSSLRAVIAGGDTVPVSLQERFQKYFGIVLPEVYGMTETLPVSMNPPDAIRQGSVGTPRVATRIVDLRDRDVAPGETGEIVVRSPSNCIGYWNDEPATADLLRGGWLHTGDLGSIDSDGYLWFKGRLKQIIIRCGSNISPQEVEEALYQHPAVLEAGVIGVPHGVYGEMVVAFVALRAGTAATEEELREHARGRLADYKVPERIYFIAELPKGITGKVQRRALKEMLARGASASA